MNTFQFFSFYKLILFVAFLIFTLFSRYNYVYQTARLIQTIVFLVIIIIAGVLNSSVREGNEWYYQLVLQYFTLAIKKLSMIVLQNRLKLNMNYDDIIIVMISCVMYDHIFIFTVVMVQNNTPFKQFLAIFNFIVLQVQNIQNVNLFYQLYKYFVEKKIKWIRNLLFIKYTLMMITGFYILLIQIAQQLGIILFMNVVLQMANKAIKRNDQKVIEQLERNIQLNGYLEMKIEENQISDMFA